MNIALLDYGVGNLHSLTRALEVGGAAVTRTDSVTDVLAADALVLPGVGAFGAAAARLDGARAPIAEAIRAGMPALGICLGMQLLFDGSEEGAGAGIGLIPGRVRRLRSRPVPHMGWNDVAPDPDATARQAPDPLVAALAGEPVYYANSYAVEPVERSVILGWTEYGPERFPAVVRAGRAWGVQFHPEKSGAGGLRLLRAFLGEVGR